MVSEVVQRISLLPRHVRAKGLHTRIVSTYQGSHRLFRMCIQSEEAQGQGEGMPATTGCLPSDVANGTIILERGEFCRRQRPKGCRGRRQSGMHLQQTAEPGCGVGTLATGLRKRNGAGGPL